MATHKMKEEFLSFRVSTDYKEEVEEYLDRINEGAVTEMTGGDLFRAAVSEYMKNHPVKED